MSRAANSKVFNSGNYRNLRERSWKRHPQVATGRPQKRRLRYGILGAAIVFGSMTLLVGVEAVSAATPTNVAFTPGSTSALATSNWTVGFTSSATGALTASSAVVITFGDGFLLPSAPAVTFVSGFTGACASTGVSSGQHVTITLGGTCALAAHTPAVISIAGITNPGAGTYANTGFTLATSADSATSPATDVIVAATPTNVVTAPPSAVTVSSASLNGTVNPDGVATTYYFRYGTTLAYGATTPLAAAGSGTTAVLVSAGLSGLSSNGTYDVQLVAMNANGTTYGGNMTFFTTSTNTTTRLLLRKSSDPFGKETRQRFTVSVTTAPGGALPSGQVAVLAGNATLCTITLSSGAGSCTLPPRALGAKTYRIYAVYQGSGAYGSSMSDKHLYRVVR